MIVKVNNGITDIVITMDTDVNTSIEPKYQPRDEYMLYLLEQSYGYYGHNIDPNYTTPLDMYTALLSLDGYRVVEVDEVPIPKPLKGLLVT